MRLTTWNVNGIRNPFSYPPWNAARTFPAMFDVLGSDIVVMQELKIQRKDLRDDMVLIDGWDAYFSLPKHKKGYSGVGIYTRNSTCAPIKAEEGLLGVLPSTSGVPYCELPEGESVGGYPTALQIAELGVDPAVLDAEGRCLILEFPAFVLFGVYSPANSNGLRDGFRFGFLNALDCRIRNLVRAGKRVVLVGDLNVSRSEIDTAGAVDECRKAGMSHEEYMSLPNRRVFNQLLIGGEVIGERDEGREQGVLWDTTRGFHPHRQGMYTHWEQKINARPGNYGGRIDFVLVSGDMRGWIKDANIQEGLLGSDHCPVFADFHDQVELDGHQRSLIDMMNHEGVFDRGERKQEWKISSAPAFSAKKLPEFDKRRSIKSMFAVPSSKRKTPEPAPKHKLGETDDQAVSNSESSLHSRKVPDLQREKSNKRPKLEQQSSSNKGQQSLKGFFQAKDKTGNEDAVSSGLFKGTHEHLVSNSASHQESDVQPSQTDHSPSSPTTEAASEHLKSPDGAQLPAAADRFSRSPSPSQVGARVAAVEENQRSWGNLFARPVAPLCEGHSEPCKTMLTKKKGSNQGRSFWMCARPLGPSGEKERGTEWRCPTFIWCSDWSGRKEREGEG